MGEAGFLGLMYWRGHGGAGGRARNQPGVRRGAGRNPAAVSSSPGPCTPTWRARTCTMRRQRRMEAQAALHAGRGWPARSPRWAPSRVFCTAAGREDPAPRRRQAAHRLASQSPTATTLTSRHAAAAPGERRGHASRCSSSRRARPGFTVGRLPERRTGWLSSDTAELVRSRIAASPPPTCWARQDKGFYSVDEELADRAHCAAGAMAVGHCKSARLRAHAGRWCATAGGSAPRCSTSRRRQRLANAGRQDQRRAPSLPLRLARVPAR